MSNSPCQNACMVSSSFFSGSCPCAMPIRAFGASSLTNSTTRSSPCTRLWTQKTCPSRASSRSITCRSVALSRSSSAVETGLRSGGAVSMTESSRTPDMDNWSVRGIGVAVNVSASTFFLIFLSFSLCRTPKRCSSSRISKPRFGRTTSSERSRCVPMRMSICPEAAALSTSFCLAEETKRLSSPTLSAKPESRERKVW